MKVQKILAVYDETKERTNPFDSTIYWLSIDLTSEPPQVFRTYHGNRSYISGGPTDDKHLLISIENATRIFEFAKISDSKCLDRAIVPYEPYPFVEKAKELVEKSSKVSSETLRSQFNI